MPFLLKISKNCLFGLDLETQKARWHDWIKKNDGKFCRVELITNKRSLEQNSLMWVYLETIERETGNSTDDLHRIFKGMFLPKRKVTLGKQSYEMSGSTTELTKGAFIEYLMKIEAWAGQEGITLPNPEAYRLERDSALLKNN